MKSAFKIKEVKPKIFLFEFKNNYDMCMHFLRYQEFYESAYAKFRGKKFGIFDFMRWYAIKYGKGVFSYPDDWDGFNIPGDIIKQVWDLHIDDKNIYDYEMLMAWNKCNRDSNGQKFYIIGVVKKNGALEHEIAHGMFYLHLDYQKEMTKLVKELDPAIRKDMYATLKKLGYTTKVFVDEAQAYMATGLSGSFLDQDKWSKERQKFEEVFKKYY